MSFFFTSCHKYSDNQSIILHGIHTETGKYYSFFIQDFFPFIGIRNTDENLSKIVELEKKQVIIRKEVYTEDGVPFQDYYHNYVVKIYIKNTKEIGLREKFDHTYQDDVIYETVFKTTKNIHVGFIIRNFDNISKRKRIYLPRQNKFSEKMKKKFTIYIRVSEQDVIGF